MGRREVASIVMFPCGCTVSYQTEGREVSGVGACSKHLPVVWRELGALAGMVLETAVQIGRPMTIDPEKMSKTLERALELEAAEGGPVDGSA
jgi:hypothetical protein